MLSHSVGDYSAQSGLRNIYDCGLTLKAEKTKKWWLDNVRLNWHFDWLPTGRKFVHGLAWEDIRSERMSQGINETEYRLTGQFSWDARRDSSKNLQFGFFATKVETENGTDTRTFRTEFESQGSKVATMSRYFPRRNSWRWEKRWVTNFGLDYKNPQNQSYHLGIETFPANEEDSTITGKVNFTTQEPGEEMNQFPIEVIYSSEDSNGYDVKLIYQSSHLDKSGQKYPTFPVNFRYKNENNTKLGAAWVPTTGELLFLASETRIPDDYDNNYAGSSVKEFWIAGMNFSVIGHDGHTTDKGLRFYEREFMKLRKSTDVSKKYTELSGSRSLEAGIIYHDSLGPHLLTNFSIDMRSLFRFYFYAKFNWENETIQNHLNDCKLDAQKAEEGMTKIITKIWNDLAQNVTDTLIFNFSSLFDHLKENRPDFLASRISKEVENSVNGINIENSEMEIPVPSYPIINSAMKRFTAILDGIGAFFNYLSTPTSTTNSENSTTISNSVDNINQKIQKRFTPIVETLDAVYKFLTLESSTSTTTTFGFIVNRIGKLGQFLNRLIYGESEILQKWNSLSKVVEELIRRSFPFNETTEFIRVFKEYSNLDENEDDQQNKTIKFKTVVSKFGHFVEKGWEELYKADYEKGVITSRVPVIFFLSYYVAFKYLPSKNPVFSAYETYESKFLLLGNISTQLKSFFKPTDAYAILFGPNFITFDTRNGNISSECKYLLAAETKEKRFSISAQFKYNDAKKTYSASDIFLITKNPSESFHLDRNSHMAKVNEVETNSSSQWAKIESPKDKVEIICSNGNSKLNLDICAIKISGYYHGNVMGLLGMFNNERADDFILPSGRFSSYQTEFSDTWKIDENCVESHDEVSGAGAESANYDDICSQFTNKLDEGQVSPNYPISPAYKKICEVQAWKTADSSIEYIDIS